MALIELLGKLEAVLRVEFLPLVELTRSALREDAAGRPSKTIDVEAAIWPMLRAVAAVLVEFLASEVDGGRVANRHVCECGQHYEFVRKQGRWIGLLIGEVRPVRALYRCRKCGKTRVPLDRVWGLQSGLFAMGQRYLAPKAQEALLRLCAAMPYEEAVRHFCDLTGLRVSAMLAWRLVQHVGAAVRKQDERAPARLRLRRAAEAVRWFLGADGVMVAFWKDATRRKRKVDAGEAREKKPRSGRGIVWREVRIGVVARLWIDGTIERGTQRYFIALMSAARFRVCFAQFARRHGVGPGAVVVAVSDGAAWLRALWARHFPWATAVRDFYHAAQHLGVMSEALYGEGSRWAARWRDKMVERLKAGELPAMLDEWQRPGRKPRNAAAWQRELNYFRSQQHAMAYAQFREQKLPIGSGAVEGACKSAVGSRFKRPGARWTEAGFQNLAVLRAGYAGNEALKALPTGS